MAKKKRSLPYKHPQRRSITRMGPKGKAEPYSDTLVLLNLSRQCATDDGSNNTNTTNSSNNTNGEIGRGAKCDVVKGRILIPAIQAPPLEWTDFNWSAKLYQGGVLETRQRCEQEDEDGEALQTSHRSHHMYVGYRKVCERGSVASETETELMLSAGGVLSVVTVVGHAWDEETEITMVLELSQ